MKKAIIVLGIATAAAVALPAAAQDTNWYVTTAIGQSKFDIDGQSGDNKDTSYNIGLGYNFTKNLGLEAGYTDFGKVQLQGFTGKAHSPYAALILSAPVIDAWSVYGRLGFAHTERTVKHPVFGSESDTKNEAYYGLGTAYAFTKNISGTLEYQKLNSSDVSAIAVGIKFGF